jgi:para-aminobenzoate synthetase component 1
MNAEQFATQVSALAKNEEPFIFILDFELQKPLLCTLGEAAKHDIYYNIKGNSNAKFSSSNAKIELKSFPVPAEYFDKKFKKVIEHLNLGNTYLLNLTFPSKIDINLSLKEIFCQAQASYKLLYKDSFVVFSPECFIKITDDSIFTYPMKGTIDARIEDAGQKLLQNEKETWEHNTIVDLMRNDLSMVASNIEVTQYRYLEKIKTNKNEILQSSSEIKGKLPDNWKSQLGENLIQLLPAGSVSGAPKQKTLEIIRENEMDARGYYSGVFGIFDGINLDSAVMIRYIEKVDDTFYYRSGGGITAQSIMEDEYNELIQKIYVPAV